MRSYNGDQSRRTSGEIRPKCKRLRNPTPLRKVPTVDRDKNEFNNYDIRGRFLKDFSEMELIASYACGSDVLPARDPVHPLGVNTGATDGGLWFGFNVSIINR